MFHSVGLSFALNQTPPPGRQSAGGSPSQCSEILSTKETRPKSPGFPFAPMADNSSEPFCFFIYDYTCLFPDPHPPWNTLYVLPLIMVVAWISFLQYLCERGAKISNWFWLVPAETAKLLTPSGHAQGKRKFWASVLAWAVLIDRLGRRAARQKGKDIS